MLLQQWRLLPLLSATFALTIFSYTFFLDFIEFHVAMVLGEKSDRQVLLAQSNVANVKYYMDLGRFPCMLHAQQYACYMQSNKPGYQKQRHACDMHVVITKLKT